MPKTSDDLTYQLSIAPDLEPYRPEVEFACAFLDESYGLRRTESAERVLHYGSRPPKGAISVPAALFPHGVRLSDTGIHPAQETLNRLATGRNAPLLAPNFSAAGRPGRSLAYDALGLIFLMLSRLEERDRATLDRYGRFPYPASIAGRLGIDGDPPADRAAHDLARALTELEEPPSLTTYRVLLTHDVDRLRGYHQAFEPLRTAAGDVIKRRRPDVAIRRLRDAYLGGEPWRSARWLMDRSERYGTQSRFYFMGPSRSSMDSPYAMTMRPLLHSLAKEIMGRGHVVGFHPGFDTATDADAWRHQRAGLEEVIGQTVREGRQHVLRYVVGVTPEIWNDAGMELDCTLAYPEATGFRSGTCRPHHAYSLTRRRALGLRQSSTAIVEFGMFGGKYRDLRIDEALSECERAAETCRRYGGTLTILYHTGQTRPPLATFYERLLECVH